MTTAEKLRKAEDRVAKAQSALDKAQSGLHAAEEAAKGVEKAGRHPVLITLGAILMVGLIWWIIDSARKES
jgi:hypothetical protein